MGSMLGIGGCLAIPVDPFEERRELGVVRKSHDRFALSGIERSQAGVRECRLLNWALQLEDEDQLRVDAECGPTLKLDRRESLGFGSQLLSVRGAIGIDPLAWGAGRLVPRTCCRSPNEPQMRKVWSWWL